MATVESKEQLLHEEKRLIAEIEKKHGKTVDELRAEREKRVKDAIELRIPDRVPVTIPTRFATRYVGITASSQYYDQAAYRAACKKVLLDFEPDTAQATQTANSGLVFELLDSKQNAWPGGPLPQDSPYQFVEREYMKADEYDWFLSDPSDFVLRGYLPRVYGTLAPITRLPPMRTLTGTGGFTGILGLFARPEFRDLADKLYRAGQEQSKVVKDAADFVAELERLGFPSQERGGRNAGGAPFDAISDFLRGMRGAMIDMYRCPDKLLAATDKILEWRIAQAQPADPKGTGHLTTGGGALHRGSDGFMSLQQFEKFYWPGLKKATLVSIDLGYTVSHFFEGVWDQRLHYLLEFPKGKVVFHCEKTDVFKAKEVLGGHMCIQGGVPASLLEVGSPQEVEEHVKKLIKVVGKGGGLIVGAGTSSEGAKPENVRAMVDTVKKHGRY